MAKRARGRDPFVQSETLGPAAVLSQESAPLYYDYGQLPVEQRDVVRRAARMIKPLLRRTAEDIFVIGGELRAVKALLPHGRYTEWLEVEFGLSDRMAQHFVNVRERLGAKSEKFSVLPPSTLYLLAAPSTPEEAIINVETRLDAGERLTVASVKSKIDDLKAQIKSTTAPRHIPKEELTPAQVAQRELYNMERALDLVLRVIQSELSDAYVRHTRSTEVQSAQIALRNALKRVNALRGEKRVSFFPDVPPLNF